MNNVLMAQGLAIHFKNDLSNNDHYIYEVEVENADNSGVNYDMKFLFCNNGTNVLDLDDFDMNLIVGKTLLNEGHLVVGNERVPGVVAFEKDVTITNDPPIFEYDVVSVETFQAQISLGGA